MTQNEAGSTAKPQQAPRAERLERSRAPGRFPLGYKQTFWQWWAGVSPASAEHKVLSFVPYLKQAPTQEQTGMVAASDTSPDSTLKDDTSHSTSLTKITSKEEDPYGPRRWHSSLVKLPGAKGRALNEFSIERMGEPVQQNLVMLHGYGAGLGFYYKNFESLSRMQNWRVYALDMLGMGRSSRPPFRIYAKDRQAKISEAEDWFVDSLEAWRKERKLEKFTLLGHSLGGYMACAYALKYPGHLNKLILASPVGIPEDPYAVNSDMPEPEASTMQSEFTQDQKSTTAGSANGEATGPPKPNTNDNNTPKQRPYPKWLVYLWDANISPFSLVRWSGPLGPRLVSGWTSRRFSQMPASEAQALHDYAYSLFKQPGSGEYALAYILAPGAFARSPLIRRIGNVGSGEYIPEQPAASDASAASPKNVEKVREKGVPVTLIYGEHDWMDAAGGLAAAEKLKEAKKQRTMGLSKEEASKDQGDVKCEIVKGAGHHVYLDGWQEFNETMRREMGDVELRQRRLVEQS